MPKQASQWPEAKVEPSPELEGGVERLGKIVPGNKRCKWHGVMSTGPRTPEGKAKCARNLLGH